MAVAKKAASKKKLGPQCKCIEKVNEQIGKQFPVMLDVSISLTMGAVCVIKTTPKADALRPKRGTKYPSFVACNFCPFCGTEYVT